MIKNKVKKIGGFTLAELLIVIAIIAILIAIAVPVFSSSMKRAQMATDDANFRAAKSAAVNAILSGKIMAYDNSGVLKEVDINEAFKADPSAGGVFGGYYSYCTDGNFANYGATLPSGVEFVTAKYTAKHDEPNYSEESYHNRGAKINITIQPNDTISSDDKESNVSYDDYYRMASDYGFVIIQMYP